MNDNSIAVVVVDDNVFVADGGGGAPILDVLLLALSLPNELLVFLQEQSVASP
jgi:hypothetical protein